MSKIRVGALADFPEGEVRVVVAASTRIAIGNVEGELYAFTEVRAGAPLGFVQDLPLCVGLVRIGGLLLSSRIDNARFDELRIGDRVQLKIVELEDGRVFYRFAKPKEK